MDRVVKNTGTKTRKGSLKENGDRTSVHNDIIKHDMYAQEFTNYPRGILEYSQDSLSLHPTQKPVNVIKRLVEIFTDEGDVVIDPCAGSASTLRACTEINRSSFGFEIEKNSTKMLKKKCYQM